ncbi:MAG: hypothetical protein P1U50_00950 [Parvibaculaceae bacterium]|nr:hypothetical protein [Parvibaculaceae bacterium]
MSKALNVWTTPAPLKGDEFQVWLHNDTALRMHRREEAVLFVSHKDLDRIDHRAGDGILSDVTEDFCMDWMNMRSHSLPPQFIPEAVKRCLPEWEEINSAKRALQLEAAE